MATLKQQLAAFRAATSVRKDGHNPFFNSSYYELEDILNALKGASDFNVYFAQYFSDGNLVTEIEHEKEVMRSFIKLPELHEKNHQEVAKQITYFRRIQLITMFGICEPDNDGQSIAVEGGLSPRTSGSKASGSVPPSLPDADDFL